ncbi:DMT family transporter [Paraburkholderia xenovorans]|uniref:DMT family transporter n=1 Tax=Paraburkholderia xenovorans TaxID=36873 RepID=UPI0038BB05DB
MRADYLKLLLATLLLSSYLVASKLVLHEVPVFIATFVRLLSALIALSGYLWVRRIRVPRIGLRDAGVVTTQAGLGIMLFSVLALYGLRFTGAIESGVVLSMVPVVTSLTACIVFREHLSRMSVGGILIAVGGVCAMTVLSAGNGSTQANEHSVLGMGLLFGAVICETVFLTFGKLLSKPLAPPVLSWLLCAIGALMVALPAGVEWRGMSLGAVSWRSWALLVYSGVAVNSVAVVLMYDCLKRLETSVVSAFTALTPVSGTILAVLLAGEDFHLYHVAVVGLAVSGVYLVVRDAETRSRQSAPDAAVYAYAPVSDALKINGR